MEEEVQEDMVLWVADRSKSIHRRRRIGQDDDVEEGDDDITVDAEKQMLEEAL